VYKIDRTGDAAAVEDFFRKREKNSLCIQTKEIARNDRRILAYPFWSEFKRYSVQTLQRAQVSRTS